MIRSLLEIIIFAKGTDQSHSHTECNCRMQLTEKKKNGGVHNAFLRPG